MASRSDGPNSLNVYAADGYASYGGLKSGVFGLEFGLQLFENALAKSLGCDLFYDRPATALRQT